MSPSKIIKTPTGHNNQFHHLLPRFRHNQREPGLGAIEYRSGLVPLPDRLKTNR